MSIQLTSTRAGYSTFHASRVMSLYLSYLVLVLNLHYHIVVSATTSIDFFTDDTCQDGFATVQTSTNVGNGQCGIMNGTNSVNLTMLDPDCTVTVYSDPYCTSNKTPVRYGACKSESIGSYSVDCTAVNGTNDDSYTTILAGSSDTSSQLQPSSIPTSSSSSSQQGSFILIQPTTLSSLAGPFSTQLGTSISTDPRTTLSTAAPSSETATSASTDLESTSSTPRSSSTTSSPPTNPTKRSGNKGRCKKIEIIVPIAVLACILLAIAVKFRKRILVFVVPRRESRISATQNGDIDSDVSVGDLSKPEHPDAKRPGPLDTKDFWESFEKRSSKSDGERLNSGFSSSRYRLPDLQDRTR